MLGCQLDYTQNELKSKGLGPAVRKLSFKSSQVGRSPLTWAHLVQAAVPGTRKEEARSLPACPPALWQVHALTALTALTATAAYFLRSPAYTETG